jgi:hypothetical protein
MRTSTLQLGAELAKEGLVVGWHFGSRSIAGLVRIAEYIERSVLLEGSFRRTATGFRFILLNPPLRLGAFVGAELVLDGTPLDGTEVTVRSEERPEPRTLASIAPAEPIHLLPGVPVEFSVRTSAPLDDAIHTVRLNLENAAIPPRVWFEFRERLTGSPGP